MIEHYNEMDEIREKGREIYLKSFSMEAMKKNLYKLICGEEIKEYE